jgi:L-ascorbate metabolism protein UlaG (beta-lactamase superfamily)
MNTKRVWPRRVAIALGVVAGGLAATAYYFLATYEAPPVDPGWTLRARAEVPAGSVTVRWTGTATLVFSDGETTWMTDGWFSRPGPLALLFGEIAPDLDAIERGLARNGVAQQGGRLESRPTRSEPQASEGGPPHGLAAVFPVHSHYDHAMDAPEVARHTGALLLGSESTANIGRGWGLAERQIRVVRNREPIRLGRFTITPIAARHFEFPDPRIRERALGDPEITEPLVPPVSAFAYKVGVTWVLHVAHPRGTYLVVGSAGYLEGALEGFAADVVFLGTGGLGTQTDAYRETYWRETIERAHPTRVIPIHWDSLTAPIEGPFRGPLRAESFLSRGTERALAFLKQKEAANPGIAFQTLPRYEPVALF